MVSFHQVSYLALSSHTICAPDAPSFITDSQLDASCSNRQPSLALTTPVTAGEPSRKLSFLSVTRLSFTAADTQWRKTFQSLSYPGREVRAQAHGHGCQLHQTLFSERQRGQKRHSWRGCERWNVKPFCRFTFALTYMCHTCGTTVQQALKVSLTFIFINITAPIVLYLNSQTLISHTGMFSCHKRLWKFQFNTISPCHWLYLRGQQ